MRRLVYQRDNGWTHVLVWNEDEGEYLRGVTIDPNGVPEDFALDRDGRMLIPLGSKLLAAALAHCAKRRGNPRSARESKRDRTELHRAIALDLRTKARAKLRDLKERAREATRERRRMKASAASACAEGRRAAKDRRAFALAELAAAKNDRKAARGACAARTGQAKEALGAVRLARSDFRTEKAYQAELRRIERGNRQTLKERAASRAPTKKERRGESDGAVLANIPSEFVPLWERVKSKIGASDRQSRTEAFLAYAHDHEREVIAALEDDGDRTMRDLLRERDAAQSFVRKSRYTEADLEEAPF